MLTSKAHRSGETTAQPSLALVSSSRLAFISWRRRVLVGAYKYPSLHYYTSPIPIGVTFLEAVNVVSLACHASAFRGSTRDRQSFVLAEGSAGFADRLRLFRVLVTHGVDVRDFSCCWEAPIRFDNGWIATSQDLPQSLFANEAVGRRRSRWREEGLEHVQVVDTSDQ